jgi:hypothetical protein
MGEDLSVTTVDKVRLESIDSFCAEHAIYRVTAASDANLKILLHTRFTSFLRIGSM